MTMLNVLVQFVLKGVVLIGAVAIDVIRISATNNTLWKADVWIIIFWFWNPYPRSFPA